MEDAMNTEVLRQWIDADVQETSGKGREWTRDAHRGSLAQTDDHGEVGVGEEPEENSVDGDVQRRKAFC